MVLSRSRIRIFFIFRSRDSFADLLCHFVEIHIHVDLSDSELLFGRRAAVFRLAQPEFEALSEHSGEQRLSTILIGRRR